MTNTKQCPYCGEQILEDAIKCKHCKEMLVKENSTILENIIINYINTTYNKSNCILTGKEITKDVLTKAKIDCREGEKPLILLYKKSLFFDLKTRILITNKRIYFKALPDTIWTGLTANFAKKIEGCCEILGLEYLEIAEHDHCLGTAYIGHQLKINNTVVGLVRMGVGIEYEDFIITYLNNLFNKFAEANIIKHKVRKYRWQ